MIKLRKVVDGARVFFADVGMEMKKTSWPERQDLLESTMAVIVSVLLLALFIGVCDEVLVRLLRALTSLT